MTFSEYRYERPEYEVFKKQMTEQVEKLKSLQTAKEQIALVKEIHDLINTIVTSQQLVEIRNTLNTKDEFYEKECEYWDENSPVYEEVIDGFRKVILASPFRAELEEAFSKQYFDIMENAIKVFSPSIIAESQQENKLITEYNKLVASAEIEFDGKIYNLSGLGPFKLSKDKEVRQRAHAASNRFFEENAAGFDRIYDELVKVRDTKAKKLGFKNYVEFGYINMNRTDYNAEMVATFRKQVLESIVPVATELYVKQQERIGTDKLAYYDEAFEFITGNATPQGDAAFILENGKKMYAELSPETKEFFEYMTEHELLDLETKPGKQAGGYCTFIPEYKSPFIFSNFNGTSGDVDVLTHEAGHAFQVYQSRWIDVPNLIFPTYESCEIHSMSMEFITWPWMELFFKEQADKYKYTHLGGAIKFIPYGIVVDAFQHYVYENPTASPADRKNAWRALEKEYLPHKNYDDSEFLEQGTWWYRQGHIFSTPFYYIDYTLAQICALQFWKKMNDNREEGWQDYLNICNKGGTKSFLQLVELGNMISPFKEGCVDSVVDDIRTYLMGIDDKTLV